MLPQYRLGSVMLKRKMEPVISPKEYLLINLVIFIYGWKF